MELVRKSVSSKKTKPYPKTIANAVEDQIYSYGDYENLGDEAYYNVSSLCQFVGELIELLHQRHVLLDGDILRLLTKFDEYRGAPRDS